MSSEPAMLKYVARLIAAAGVVLALPLGAPAPAEGFDGPPGFRPFAPDSIWNLPLRHNVPLAPDGRAQVDWLRGQIAAHGSYINASTCGMPIVWAAPDTPRVKVTLATSSYQEKALIRAWQSVPIPEHARPANCQDKNFAVLQTQPDGTVTQWEFWSATRREDKSWVARWGGVTQNVALDRGVASSWSWRDPTGPSYQERMSGTTWNVTASSISMTAGVITEDDLRRRRIDHAVAMALTDAAKGRWHWPAQRSDGGSADPSALPEGARLRIDPSVDLDALPMPPLVRMIAEAAQTYGIVVRDRTWSANVFYVESPEEGQTSQVGALLDGARADQALAGFPWEKLQVLQGKSCTTSGSCLATAKAVIDVDTAAPRVGQPVALDTTNSVLEHARTAVEWDFDGDGIHEARRGRDVKATFVPAAPGPRRIGVRITTRDGSVVTGTRTIDAAPALSPAVLRPSAVRTAGFYAYTTSHGALRSLDATTAAPDRPDRYRKLYSSHASGSFEASFGGASVAGTRGGATLSAWVDCTATRCLRLRIENAAGKVLGAAEPAFGTSGWVTVRAAGPLAAADVPGLRLTATVRNAAGASGSTSVSAASLSVDGA
jgi:hypothetical protein